MTALSPLTEDNLVGYWLRSGVVSTSVDAHRSRIPRYLKWLAARGVIGVPPHRARSQREAREFAHADNLITLQMLQLSRNGQTTPAAHHLRNFMHIRDWHV